MLSELLLFMISRSTHIPKQAKWKLYDERMVKTFAIDEHTDESEWSEWARGEYIDQ